MKKIMFNDKYGLTKAVLEGRKTMTRRFAEKVLVEDENGYLCWTGKFKPSAYKPGDVVAVAQNLRDMGYDPHAKDWSRGNIWGLDHSPAWTNKMFVASTKCIHRIRITNFRIERLQDISAEDCLREGIYEVPFCEFAWEDNGKTFKTARESFAALIDKVSGKGTWDDNPFVFVYEFELVK